LYFKVGASKASALYSVSTEALSESLMKTIAEGMMADEAHLISDSLLLFFLTALLKFLFSPFFAEEWRLFDIVRLPLVVYLFISLSNLLAIGLPYPLMKVKTSFLFLSALLVAYCFLFAIGSLD